MADWPWPQLPDTPTNRQLAERPDYRVLWDRLYGGPAPGRPPPRQLPCRHGPDIISYCPLGDCTQDVHRCELDHGHEGRVTLGGFCATCPDYSPAD